MCSVILPCQHSPVVHTANTYIGQYSIQKKLTKCLLIKCRIWKWTDTYNFFTMKNSVNLTKVFFAVASFRRIWLQISPEKWFSRFTHTWPTYSWAFFLPWSSMLTIPDWGYGNMCHCYEHGFNKVNMLKANIRDGKEKATGKTRSHEAKATTFKVVAKKIGLEAKARS